MEWRHLSIRQSAGDIKGELTAFGEDCYQHKGWTMKLRQVLAVIALVLGASGCASTSSSYRSDLRYEDGSYYSPATAGRGDYYLGPERYDPYSDSFYLSTFGSPYGSSFGGYCSAMYRYCPSFWYDPFHRFGYFGGYGYWADPFWYVYDYRYVPRRHRHAQADHPQADGEPEVAVTADGRPVRLERSRGDRRWRGSVPVMPAPANGTVRMRYPTRDPRPRIERPAPRPEYIAPEPRVERDSDDDGADRSRSGGGERQRVFRRSGERRP